MSSSHSGEQEQIAYSAILKHYSIIDGFFMSSLGIHFNSIRVICYKIMQA